LQDPPNVVGDLVSIECKKILKQEELCKQDNMQQNLKKQLVLLLSAKKE
jgi:hypothetical protein